MSRRPATVASFVVAFCLWLTSPAGAAPIRTTSAATGIFQSNILLGRTVFTEASRRDTSVSGQRHLVAMAFGLSTHSLVGVVLPYVEKTLEFDGREDSIRGLGDIRIFGHYRFWQRLGRGRRDMAGFRLSLDVPTGSTSRGLDFDVPEPLRRAVQPGTGSTDVLGQLILSREDYRFNVDLNLGYAIKTEGKGLDAGDALIAGSSLGAFLFPERTRPQGFEVNAQVELGLQHSDRSELRGEKIAASGGTTLTVAPGLQAIIGDRILLEVSVRLLAAEKLNGPQPKLDHDVLVGIRIAL